MSPQELAALLTGRGYRKEITDDEANAAFDAGLVVVFGASDDIAILRGKIDDEVNCYDGGTIYLSNDGLITNACSDDACPYFAAIKNKATTIEAVWDRKATRGSTRLTSSTPASTSSKKVRSIAVASCSRWRM